MVQGSSSSPISDNKTVVNVIRVASNVEVEDTDSHPHTTLKGITTMSKNREENNIRSEARDTIRPKKSSVKKL